VQFFGVPGMGQKFEDARRFAGLPNVGSVTSGHNVRGTYRFSGSPARSERPSSNSGIEYGGEHPLGEF